MCKKLIINNLKNEILGFNLFVIPYRRKMEALVKSFQGQRKEKLVSSWVGDLTTFEKCEI